MLYYFVLFYFVFVVLLLCQLLAVIAQGRLCDKWKEIVNKSTGSLTDWLAEFYDELLTVWQTQVFVQSDSFCLILHCLCFISKYLFHHWGNRMILLLLLFIFLYVITYSNFISCFCNLFFALIFFKILRSVGLVRFVYIIPQVLPGGFR